MAIKKQTPVKIDTPAVRGHYLETTWYILMQFSNLQQSFHIENDYLILEWGESDNGVKDIILKVL